MIRSLAVAVFSVIALSACSSEQRIDGSSQQAFQDSVSRMRANMTVDQQQALSEAITVIAFKDVGDAVQTKGLAALADLQVDPSAMFEQVSSRVAGKTAEEVIEVADAIKAERRERQLAATETEIAALQVELLAAEQAGASAAGVLEGIVVGGARFQMSEDTFMRKPVISFSVSNNTGKPIRRLFFRGILETPGRSVPWVDEEFNYDVPGGIESGEKLALDLAPNMFGAWANDAHADRTDLVLTVSPVDAEYADGSRIVSSGGGDIENLKRRLDGLLEKQRELALEHAAAKAGD